MLNMCFQMQLRTLGHRYTFIEESQMKACVIDMIVHVCLP